MLPCAGIARFACVMGASRSTLLAAGAGVKWPDHFRRRDGGLLSSSACRRALETPFRLIRVGLQRSV